jgi:hypothetical protein
MRRPRRALLAALLALTTILLPAFVLPAITASAARAAVPDAKVAVPRYVHSLCVDFVAWRKRLVKLGNSYSRRTGSSSSVDTLRTSTAKFFDDAGATTAKLTRQLRRIGTPATDHGAEIAAALGDAITNVATAFRSAATQVSGITATDAASFADQLQAISSASQKQISDAGVEFAGVGARFRAGDFDSAESSDPACKPLRKG